MAVTTQTEARIVGDALVVSFAGAEPPRLWRADLARVSSAAMELRQEDNGTAALVVTADGRAETVAQFAARDAGIEALQAVSRAMMDMPQGAMMNAPQNGAAPRAGKKTFGGFFAFLAKLLLWIVAVIVALFILAVLLLTSAPKGLVSTPPDHVALPVPSGAPVTADELFGDR